MAWIVSNKCDDYNPIIEKPKHAPMLVNIEDEPDVVAVIVTLHKTNDSIPLMLSQFLFSNKSALFISKWFTNNSKKFKELLNDPLHFCSSTLLCGKINTEIDQALLNTVAQSAADGLLYLGYQYTEKMQRTQEVI